MTEEKAKAETPAGAPVAAAPEGAAAAPAPKEAKPQGKSVKPANCVVCNKTLKKNWYYRNGSYYCTKRCWKGTLSKAEAAEGAAPAAS